MEHPGHGTAMECARAHKRTDVVQFFEQWLKGDERCCSLLTCIVFVLMSRTYVFMLLCILTVCVHYACVCQANQAVHHRETVAAASRYKNFTFGT